MKKILQKLKSADIFEGADQCYKAGLASKNLKERYRLYNEGNSLLKIAKEIEKWETITTKGF